jgi:flagellar biosynthetic protein FliQ
MTGFDAMEIARSGLVLTLTIAGPLLFTSLIVGVVVSLLLCLPMIGHALSDFTLQISDRIVHG